MFDKILVPLDGSELAASILPQVAELAKKLQAELTLVHVSPGEQSAIAVPAGSTAADVLQTCQAYLNMMGKDLQHQGLKVKVVCLRGNPAQEIIRYAEEQQMGFIAMATHGAGEVAWLLGSIARKVVAHASRPVMLFRVLELEIPPLKGTIKSIKFT